MMLSFVAAALLISVLRTEAQNHIPNPPPPPPPPPPGYPDSQSYRVPTNYNPQVSDPKPDSFPASAQVSYSGPPNHIPNPPPPSPLPGYPDSQSYHVPTNYNPQVSDPKPDSFPGSAQVSYSGPPGNPGYSNNAHFENPGPQYRPPPPNPYELENLFALLFDKSLEMFERIMKGGRKKHWWRHHQHSGPPQYYPSAPQRFGPSQSYGGQPQGYFSPPQGYLSPPQGYPVASTAQQPSSFPAQPSGSAVPPPSGTQQSNYGSPPNLVYNYHDSVPQQQLFPGQSLPAAGADPSALPSPQYSAGPAPFVPPASAPAASVSSGDVKLPGNSTLPASGTPGNSS